MNRQTVNRQTVNRPTVNRALRSLLATGCILGVCASLATPAHAYVREETNWNPSSLPITYSINQATIPGTLGMASGIGAVEGGFATWAAPTCTTWRATDAGNTTTTANTNDRRNVIMWLTSWPAELGSVNSVIGVTTPVWTSGGYFIDADIQFNAQHFTWNTTGTGSSSAVDAQSIATHEEGHFLGLDHTPTSTAIMYASYSSGLKRNLGTDDQNGVCAIYPSGVAATDSGIAPVDAGGTSSDPCSQWGNTCAGCTPHGGCGFCGATSQCVSGFMAGPRSGTCASDYAWYQTDCTGMASTGGRFGDPCTQPTECASGGLCAIDQTGAGFCTRACGDDCSCPDAYQCYAASATTSICIPGTRTCSTPAPDAGTTPDQDSGSMTTDDAGTHMRHTEGCGCAAAGASENNGLGASALVLAALGLMTARRRRRAR